MIVKKYKVLLYSLTEFLYRNMTYRHLLVRESDSLCESDDATNIEEFAHRDSLSYRYYGDGGLGESGTTVKTHALLLV